MYYMCSCTIPLFQDPLQKLRASRVALAEEQAKQIRRIGFGLLRSAWTPATRPRSSSSRSRLRLLRGTSARRPAAGRRR